MIALGILLVLYAVMSWVWAFMGRQLVLLYWMHGLPAWAQWSIRGVLLAAGVALIVLGWRRRKARKRARGPTSSPTASDDAAA